MREQHYQELHDIEATYWWFQVRFRVVADVLRARQLLGPDAYLIDWGCGTGGFLEYLLRHGHVDRHQICGVEPGLPAHRVLADKGIPFVTPQSGTGHSATPQRRATVVTMLDVLEHVDDRPAFLREVQRWTVPDATLVLTVPAFRFLWSGWDDVLGHKARYTAAGLRADLIAAGWPPVKNRYLFQSMFFAAFFRSVLLRRSIARSQFPRVSPAVNAALIAWHRVETALPGLPFGTSVLAVARRGSTA